MSTEKAILAYKHYNLGNLFRLGKGVEQDLTEARKQYQKGWEQKGLKSGYEYAKMLDKGIGGEKDTKQAYEIYLLIKEHLPEAYFDLYHNEHTPEDYREIYLKKGVERENESCMMTFAELLYDAENHHGAKELYSKVISMGGDEKTKILACLELGRIKFHSGDFVGALTDLMGVQEEWIGIESRFSYLCTVRYYLGLCHLNIGQKPNAVKYFKLVKDEDHDLAVQATIKLAELIIDENGTRKEKEDIILDLKRQLDKPDLEEDDRREICGLLGDLFVTSNKWEAYEWYKTGDLTQKQFSVIEDILNDTCHILVTKQFGDYYSKICNDLDILDSKRDCLTTDQLTKLEYCHGMVAEFFNDFKGMIEHYDKADNLEAYGKLAQLYKTGIPDCVEIDYPKAKQYIERQISLCDSPLKINELEEELAEINRKTYDSLISSFNIALTNMGFPGDIIDGQIKEKLSNRDISEEELMSELIKKFADNKKHLNFGNSNKAFTGLIEDIKNQTKITDEEFNELVEKTKEDIVDKINLEPGLSSVLDYISQKNTITTFSKECDAIWKKREEEDSQSDDFVQVEAESPSPIPSLSLSKETEEKEDSLSSFLAKNKDNSEYYYINGYIALSEGDKKTAKECFKMGAKKGHQDSILKYGQLCLEDDL